jgi:hypothetical protein
MRGIGYTLVVALPGTFTAAAWTLALRVAGTPGALVARPRIPGISIGLRFLGLLLAVGGQLYVALVFAAFILRSAAHHLQGISGWGQWLPWTVCFVVATAPPLIAMLDWARQPERATQYLAARITWPLTVLGAFLFILRPSLMRLGWGWVPIV